MRSKIIHKQVMSIIHKEMQSVQHLFIVADKWHLEILVHHFPQL